MLTSKINSLASLVYTDNALLPHRSNVLLTSVNGMLAQRERVMANINQPTEDNTKVTVLTYGHFMRCELVMNVTRKALSLLAANKHLYKHEVKQIARKLNDEISRMNSVIFTMINTADERYVDGYDYVMDNFQTTLNPDYEKLYYSIMQVFTGHTTEPQIHSAFEAAGILSALCEVCIEANKKFFTVYSFMNSIYIHNTSAITHLIERLVPLLWKQTYIKGTGNVNIKDNKNVQTAVEILKYKFVDGAIIAQCLNNI